MSNKSWLAVVVITSFTACDADDGLESIETLSSGKGIGKSCDESFTAQASFENNFGLEDFCVSYRDQGSGLVNFDFEKSTERGTGRFSIALPYTEVGHVFSYNTKKMIDEFGNQPDHCEMLKSSSNYPLVMITASDGSETVQASSLDCDKQNFFEVTVNTIQTAEKSGDQWIYELSAKYARHDKEPYFLQGRFEVGKR